MLSDATGAIPLTNDAESASAKQVHKTSMTVRNSNWAAAAHRHGIDLQVRKLPEFVE